MTRTTCPDPSHAAYREAERTLAALVARTPGDYPSWSTVPRAEYIVETLTDGLNAFREAEKGVNAHLDSDTCLSLTV